MAEFWPAVFSAAISAIAGFAIGFFLAKEAIHIGRRLERAEQEAKSIAIRRAALTGAHPTPSAQEAERG